MWTIRRYGECFQAEFQVDAAETGKACDGNGKGPFLSSHQIKAPELDQLKMINAESQFHSVSPYFYH